MMAEYEREPKPYDFVKINQLGEEARCYPTDHAKYHRDTISGILHCEIKAISPVHVASGQIELTGDKRNPLVKTHTRRNGKIIIPGSSLKGCIRSIVEAISDSCVSITRARYSQLPDRASKCNDKKNLCIACRLFGAMEYLGRMRFSDAVLQDSFSIETRFIPQLYSPRSREKIYLYEDNKVIGRKFYLHGQQAGGNTPIEVCPINSVLDFTLSFDNLRKEELGLVLIAMGQGESNIHPKLGGAKPVCYGTIEISVTGSEVFENMRNTYLEYDAKPISVNISECLGAAGKLVRDDGLKRLKEILKLNQHRQCPSGNH